MAFCAVAVVGLLSFGGCSAGETPEDLVTRAQSYMDLRQKGSWDAIWTGMIDPQVREGLKRTAFMEKRRSSFDIVDFEIISVDEKGQEGQVVARMDTIVPVLKPGGGTMRIPRELDDPQDWVLREGSWYIQLHG
ncbi:MAG: hypothetical protein P8R42_12615 [Candidatus Binatia bacterium]|nr:hypothetical protein [Candidatus Binatia bacterium]